jgi:mRNA interferase HigB
MHVISRRPLREFADRHTDAGGPLGAWYRLACRGRFTNLAELKRTFASVDLVAVKGREYYVFNIGGNKYRLIAIIHFKAQRLFVRRVLTHAEYDAGGWKT